MTIRRIFAQLACSDLAASKPWFENVLGRPCDAKPMAGLAEWHHDAAGLQLFQQPKNAGHGTLTLIVSDIEGERARLSSAGISPGKIVTADQANLLSLDDPDGNTIILAEPRS